MSSCQSPEQRCPARVWSYTLLALVAALITLPVDAATLRVPEDFSTIQEAADAAQAGDTVLVAPGTYAGAGNRGIDFRGKDLILRSEAGAEQTIIDCEAEDRALWLKSGESGSAWSANSGRSRRSRKRNPRRHRPHLLRRPARSCGRHARTASGAGIRTPATVTCRSPA